MTDPFYAQNAVQPTNPNIANNAAWTVNNWQQAAYQQAPQAPVAQQAPNQAVQQQATVQQQQVQAQLQQLAQQEQGFRQQLAQLQAFVQNPQTTTQQKQQAQVQYNQIVQQLNFLLAKKQQLMTGKVNKIVSKTTKKKWSKLSMKSFMVWCGIFLLILIWIGGLVFYSFIENPERLTSMWLSLATAKQLLQAFISVFFGLLTLIGFGLLIVNIYRLFTSKNKRKINFIWWIFVWLFIFGLSIAWWMGLINKISDIAPNVGINSQNLLLTYTKYKDWPKLVWEESILIAPSSVLYSLNNAAFNSQVLTKLWSVDLNQIAITLDCWNDKELTMNLSNLQFEESCLYLNKWTYEQKLIIDYVNAQTQEKLQETVIAWNLEFASEIQIKWIEYVLNDSKTEILLGQVPSKVTFDASKIFSDFGLENYIITRDVNDDGEIDREDDPSFTYIYKRPKLYEVSFRIPALNDEAYVIPVRVEPSDVPICEINSTFLNGTEYSFITDFVDTNEVIVNYIFNVIDLSNDGIIDEFKSTKNNFDYQFPGKWLYAIKTTFLTDEGMKWECESDNLQIGSSDFDIDYILSYKTPSTPDFMPVNELDSVNFNQWIVTINEIPTIIKLNITRVSPQTATTIKKVFLDDKQILSLDEENFELTINESKQYTVTILVEDPNREIKSEESFEVIIKRDDIVGKILTKPDSVGEDPFTVTFDASTSIVNDPDDEIVFFTRNFGDWEIMKDSSQSIINHTYRYDYENEIGSYDPLLILKTKKGREISVSLNTPIIVKKEIKTFDISIISHPGQQAAIGDRINFALDLDILPSKIFWDFGDGKTLECKERECIETTKVFSEAWEYKVKVTISDNISPDIESQVVIKVVEY